MENIRMTADHCRRFVLQDTEGRWCVCWQESTDAPYIGGEVHIIAEAEDETTANRIVATLGACEGIPTEHLQPGSVKALVAACEAALSAIALPFPPELGGVAEYAVSQIRAALALTGQPTEGVTHP